MLIRPLDVDDRPAVVDLLAETFRAFFEGYARPRLGEQVFRHQHGRWVDRALYERLGLTQVPVAVYLGAL